MRFREVQVGQWVGRKGEDLARDFGRIEATDASNFIAQVRWFRRDNAAYFNTEWVRTRDLELEYPSYVFQQEAERSYRTHVEGATAPAVAAAITAGEEEMVPVSKVLEVARKYARRHSMCDVVDNALREMGIVTGNRWRVTIELPREWMVGPRVRIEDFVGRDKTSQLLRVRNGISAARESDENLGQVTVSVEEIPGQHAPVGVL